MCAKCRKQQVGGVHDRPAKKKIGIKSFSHCQLRRTVFWTTQSDIHEEIDKTMVLSIQMLTTRALHAEIVPRLKADACLAAITRFFARRREPNIRLIGDGTKVVDAAKNGLQLGINWTSSSFRLKSK